MTYTMAARFLFVNEDEVSFTSVRPKRTSTQVRRHVRLQRGRMQVQHKQHELQMRTAPSKVFQNNSSKDTELCTPSIRKSARQLKDQFFEHSTSHPLFPEPLEEFEISAHIQQLYPNAHELINFYYYTTPWPKMIIRKALESERHTLFLLCYITSIISYLNNSFPGGKLSKNDRQGSLSSDTSSCSSSPGSNDWQYPRPSQYAQDPSAPSKCSPLNTWQHSDMSASLQPCYGSPNLSILNQYRFSQDATDFFQHNPSLPEQRRPSQTSNLTQLLQLDDIMQSSHTAVINHSKSSKNSQSLPLAPALASCSSQLASCSSLASDPIHLTHQAVSTLKSRLSTKLKTSPPSLLSEFLFPVWCLFRAAILQGDEFAAVTHERFLRHLADKADDIKGLPPWLIRVILEVDLKLCNSEKSEDGDERSSAELLIESEMRERKVQKPGWKRVSKGKDY
jgi:hypothetical protein